MTKDEYVELFELRSRAACAAAFCRSHVSPGEYWPALRGERDLTLRDIGEIGHVTGFALEMCFAPAPSTEGEKWEKNDED